MKRTFVYIFSAVFLAGVCHAKTLAEEKPYGGTLVWGHATKPTILNPLLTTTSISVSLLDLLFNGLVRSNLSNGKVEPDLAKSWEVSPDGLQYTFHLRKGVKFHDGRECTAKDVVFTYEKVINPELGSPYSELYSVVKSVRAVDDYTVVFSAGKAISFNNGLFDLKIVPKHLLDGVDMRQNFFNRHPVGTGPFKFNEWEQDDTIVLLANDNYYAGRPFLDCVKTEKFDSNHDAWSALMRQEIDMVLLLGREDYLIIKNDATFKCYVVPSDSYYALQYNMNDPILADKRVREAIAYGVNRDGLIENVEQGLGMETNGPFHPQAFGFNPLVKPYEYDPQRAKELLNRAGWKDSDGDGILEKNGEDLSIKVLVLQGQDVYRKIAMSLRQDLQVIGIKLVVLPYVDEASLNTDAVRVTGAQACLRTLIAGCNARTVIDSWMADKAGRVGTLWSYTNSRVQTMFSEALLLRDNDLELSFLREIHRLIYEDQPCCFLYFPYLFHTVASGFQNTDIFFTINTPAYTIKDWYYEADKQPERR